MEYFVMEREGTLEEFREAGNGKEYSGDGIKKFFIAAKSDSVEMAVKGKETVISNEVDVSGIVISRISCNAKFLVGNSERWFTFDGEWKETDVEFIETTGMNEVVGEWPFKSIRFAVLLTGGMSVESISVDYSAWKKKKVETYNEIDEGDRIDVEWTGDDVGSIQVIY